MLPDISVIITCYNYGQYLERCLRSLFNQDMTDRFVYEIVLVDDASNDTTPIIARKFEKKFPELLYLRNDVNRGLVKSCNIGVSNSSGRYIVRVDADDYVHRSFIYLMKFVLDKNRSIQALSCDYIEVNDFEEQIKYVNCLEKEIACAVMYRREFLQDLGGYNEDFEYREGHELNKRFREKYRIGHFPAPLYFVRKHTSNRSNDAKSIAEFDDKLKRDEHE